MRMKRKMKMSLQLSGSKINDEIMNRTVHINQYKDNETADNYDHDDDEDKDKDEDPDQDEDEYEEIEKKETMIINEESDVDKTADNESNVDRTSNPVPDNDLNNEKEVIRIVQWMLREIIIVQQTQTF